MNTEKLRAALGKTGAKSSEGTVEFSEQKIDALTKKYKGKGTYHIDEMDTKFLQQAARRLRNAHRLHNLIAIDDETIQKNVARNSYTSDDTLRSLVSQATCEVCQAVLERAELPFDILEIASQSSSRGVLMSVIRHKQITEELIIQILDKHPGNLLQTIASSVKFPSVLRLVYDSGKHMDSVVRDLAQNVNTPEEILKEIVQNVNTSRWTKEYAMVNKNLPLKVKENATFDDPMKALLNIPADEAKKLAKLATTSGAVLIVIYNRFKGNKDIANEIVSNPNCTRELAETILNTHRNFEHLSTKFEIYVD